MKKTITLELPHTDTEYNFDVEVSIVDFQPADPSVGIMEIDYSIQVDEQNSFIGVDCGNGQKFTFEAREVHSLLQGEVDKVADDIFKEMMEEEEDYKEEAAERKWEEKMSYWDMIDSQY